MSYEDLPEGMDPGPFMEILKATSAVDNWEGCPVVLKKMQLHIEAMEALSLEAKIPLLVFLPTSHSEGETTMKACCLTFENRTPSIFHALGRVFRLALGKAEPMDEADLAAVKAVRGLEADAEEAFRTQRAVEAIGKMQ